MSYQNKRTTLKEFKPRVIIDRDVYDKIMYWVRKSPVEISGLGKCIYEDGAYRVTQAYLLEQENGPTSTDIDAEAAAKLLFESKDDAGHLNFWWHSHVNMGVFWSGTDESTIHEFGQNGMCLATVFNKKNEMRSAFYMKGTGFYPEVFYDNLQTEIHMPLTDAIVKEWDDEYEAKCKQRSWVSGSRGSIYATREWDQTNGRWNVWDKSANQWEYWCSKEARYVRLEPQLPAPKGKKKGKRSTHSTTNGAKSGKNGNTTTGTTKFGNMFLANSSYKHVDTLGMSSKKRPKGAIHPQALSLRWSPLRDKWMDYDAYLDVHPEDETENILDIIDQRHYYAQRFADAVGKPPVEDADIDEFYMFIRGVDFSDFYNPMNAVGGL